MDKKIEELVTFASIHFKISESKIYSHLTHDEYSIVRYIIWFYLHYRENLPISIIAKSFYRSKRTIFYGISKIRDNIKNQRIYKDMYSTFCSEYEK